MHDEHDLLTHGFLDFNAILATVPTQLDANGLWQDEEPTAHDEYLQHCRKHYRSPRKAYDTQRNRRKAPTLATLEPTP